MNLKTLVTLFLVALLVACAPATPVVTAPAPTAATATTAPVKVTETPVIAVTTAPSPAETGTPECVQTAFPIKWWTTDANGVLLTDDGWAEKFRSLGWDHNKYAYFLKWTGVNQPFVVITPLRTDKDFSYDPMPDFVQRLVTYIGNHPGVYAEVKTTDVSSPSWSVRICTSQQTNWQVKGNTATPTFPSP